MRASEARKLVEQSKEYQNEEKGIIEEGERNIKRAIADGKMTCGSGLHFRNQNHWDSIMKYWQSLGYTIVWGLGGGHNPSRYPNRISW